MKKLMYLLGVILFLSSCTKWENAIEDLNQRIDELEGTRITAVEEQIANIYDSMDDLELVDEQLEQYIKTLEGELNQLEEELANTNQQIAEIENSLGEQITEAQEQMLAELEELRRILEEQIGEFESLILNLQEQDQELASEISDLRDYVDSEISSLEDWADVTFATLDQYQSLLEEVMSLRNEIQKVKDEITAEYRAAIESAISDLEESMKEWVNEVLQDGYYSAAQINVKIEELDSLLSASDEQLREQLEEQKLALDSAKLQLTRDYQEAIEDAIAQNNGEIDNRIAAALSDALDQFEGVISSIHSQLTQLETRIAALENNFVNRIQSMSYIPRYEDQKIRVSQGANITFDFRITPLSVVERISDEHVSAFGVLTQLASTRAVETIELPFVSLTKDSVNGIISVVVSSQNIPSEFYDQAVGVSAFVLLDDGNTELISTSIALVPNN